MSVSRVRTRYAPRYADTQQQFIYLEQVKNTLIKQFACIQKHTYFLYTHASNVIRFYEGFFLYTINPYRLCMGY